MLTSIFIHLGVSAVYGGIFVLQLDEARRQRLETAVAEATMNAMEHGNGYIPS